MVGGPNLTDNGRTFQDFEARSRFWLRVVIIGWCVGLAIVAAPVGWVAARRLIRRYRAAGLEPSARAKLAYWSGLGLCVSMLGLVLVAAAIAQFANDDSLAVAMVRYTVLLGRSVWMNELFMVPYGLVILVFSVFLAVKLRESPPAQR